MALSEATETPVLDFDLEWEVAEELVEDLIGQHVAGYHVLELVGRGGFGDVYRAEHSIVKSSVAIKVLHPEVARCQNLVRRFVLEAKAANQIQSPHIVPVNYFGKLPDGRPFAVMEFLSGQSLESLLCSESPMSLVHAAALITQIAEGIGAAHTAQIIHRDLKPANLFVEPHQRYSHGLVRILDFGVAKFAPNEKENTLTQHIGPMGTPRYASPEQLTGGTVTRACDMYALGTIAYEMLAGQTPFDGESLQIVYQKTRGEARDLHELRKDLPAKVCDKIMHMIKLMPEERLSDMADIVEFFGATHAWGESYRKRNQRRIAAISLGVCALAGLGIWSIINNARSDVHAAAPANTAQVTSSLKSEVTSAASVPVAQAPVLTKPKVSKKASRVKHVADQDTIAPVEAGSIEPDGDGLIDPLKDR